MAKYLSKNQYSNLIADIGEPLEIGRKAAIKKINTILVETYWNVGKRIVEFEQAGILK